MSKQTDSECLFECEYDWIDNTPICKKCSRNPLNKNKTGLKDNLKKLED